MSLTHSLFHTIDKRELTLVVVLSSGDVHASILYTERGQLPTIIASVSKEINLTLDPSVDIMQEKTIKLLDVVLQELTLAGKGIYEIDDLLSHHQKIHKTYVYLSPLWGEFQYQTEVRKFQKPTKITKKIVSEAIGYSTKEDSETEESVHIKRIDGLFLNGYPVNIEESLHLEASELKCISSDFTVPKPLIETISSIIIKNFSAAEGSIVYETFSSAIHTVLNGLYGTRDTFSYMFFDAEDTELYSRLDGFVHIQARSRYGRAEIKRQMISEKIALDMSQARALLEGYFSGVLEESIAVRIERIVRIEKSVFNDQFIEDLPRPTYPIFVFSSPAGMGFIQAALGDKGGIIYIESERFEHELNVYNSDKQTEIQTLIACYATGQGLGSFIKKT